MAETALAEHIVFMKAKVFGMIHIEVGDREALGHHLQCRVIGDGAFGHQHTAGVNGQIIGKTFDHLTIAEDVFGVRVMLIIGEGGINDGIDIGFGEANDLAEFADDGAAFEGVVGSEECGVAVAMAFKDVVRDIIAFVP